MAASPTPEASGGDGLKGTLALARLSERRGQTTQAERLYQSAIDKFPDNPLPYHRLGVISARTGKREEAERFFQRALELAPSDPELLTDLGYYYYLCSKPDQAEQMLRSALRLKPDNARCANNLALLLGEQGRDDESFSLFRRNCTEAEAYANMAFVYTQRGELERAVAAYNHALTLDSTLRPAAEALVRLARYVPAEHLAAKGGRHTPSQASARHRVTNSLVRNRPGLSEKANSQDVRRLISDVIDAPTPVASRASPSKAGTNAGSSAKDGLVLPSSYQSFPSGPPAVTLPAGWQPPKIGWQSTPQYRYCPPARQVRQIPTEPSASLSGQPATFSGNLSSNLPPAPLAPVAGLQPANRQAGAR